MIDVLFVGHSAGRTGAPLMLLQALEWLVKNTDMSIELLLKEDGELRGSYADLVPTEVMSTGVSPWSWQGVRKLFRQTVEPANPEIPAGVMERYKAQGVRLVYANTITLGTVLEQLTELNCPMITHVHELSNWIEKCGQENLSLVKKHSDFLNCASQAVRNNLVDTYSFAGDTLGVIDSFFSIPKLIPETVESTKLRRKLGIKETDSVIVSSGFETQRKGKDLFVKLGEELKRQRPDVPWKMLWVGGWDTTQNRLLLESEIERKGMNTNFVFTGEVDNPFEYFAMADVFVLTSREEPLGLAALEAAWLGCSIVCFLESGGMADFVGVDAGIAVPYLEVTEMANAVARLTANPELAKVLVACAREKIKERHQVERGAQAMFDSIHKVLSSVS